MTCENCNKRIAVIKCDRFLRHTKSGSHKHEAQSLDVCLTCYRQIMMARAYPQVKFQQDKIPRRKKP